MILVSVLTQSSSVFGLKSQISSSCVSSCNVASIGQLNDEVNTLLISEGYEKPKLQNLLSLLNDRSQAMLAF